MVGYGTIRIYTSLKLQTWVHGKFCPSQNCIDTSITVALQIRGRRFKETQNIENVTRYSLGGLNEDPTVRNAKK